MTEIRISGCRLGFDIESVLSLKTSLWNFFTVRKKKIYVDPVLFMVLVTFNVVDKLFIINIVKLMPNAYCSYFSIKPAYKGEKFYSNWRLGLKLKTVIESVYII